MPAAPAAAGSVDSDALARSLAAAMSSQQQRVSLGDVATGDAVDASGVLNDQTVVERLLEHLPESQRNVDELKTLIRARSSARRSRSSRRRYSRRKLRVHSSELRARGGAVDWRRPGPELPRRDHEGRREGRRWGREDGRRLVARSSSSSPCFSRLTLGIALLLQRTQRVDSVRVREDLPF